MRHWADHAEGSLDPGRGARPIDSRSANGRRRFRSYGRSHIPRMRQLEGLSRDDLIALEVASIVLPFRVNDYVLNELIDWSDIPADPIYQLTFPHAEMLGRGDFIRLRNLLMNGARPEVIQRCARQIQMRMNPHPNGQMELNVPTVGGSRLSGCQHKYRETVLFFPKAGQTCHAFCTYCFRWAQFAGIEHLKFAMHEIELLVRYLRSHTEVTDVLVTGGDPLVMTSELLRRNIEPLLGEGLDHITTIRIGTRALSYWPYRFTTDHDADDLLHLFENVRCSGRQLALMAHFSHPRELQTRVAQDALRRVRDAGAIVWCQAPLVRHVNDCPDVWAELWREQVRLGAVPYYMFVARNTGPNSYFEVPLAEGLKIYSEAVNQVSGLGRTVRGPVMSTTPGKVLVDGTGTINGRKVFVLKMIQGRDPEWANRVFFAHFDPMATSLEQLEPVSGEGGFFFERSLRGSPEIDWNPIWPDEPAWLMTERLLSGGYGSHWSTYCHFGPRATDVGALTGE
jgi:KamA family protein